MRLNSVLLPQPDGPTIDTKSPSATCSETSCSACTGRRPAKVWLTPSTCSRSTLLGYEAPGQQRVAKQTVRHLSHRVLLVIRKRAAVDHEAGVGLPGGRVLVAPVAIG